MKQHHCVLLESAQKNGITKDNILCLDPATKTGWATSKGSGCWNFKPTAKEKKNRIDEYWKLYETLSEFLEECKEIKLIIMEDTLDKGGNARPNKKLDEYHGIIKLITSKFYLPPAIEVPYYSIKCHVTKNGKASKQQVIDAVTKRIGRKPETDDEADAIALYLLCSRELSK